MAIINQFVNALINHRLAIAVLMVWGAVILGGCDRGLSVPSTVPVRGFVKYKGAPAPGIRVTLHRQQKSTDVTFVPTGDTSVDGSFTLSTGAPSNGAPPGAYIVTFEKPELDPKNSVETEIDAFRGKYSDPAQSQWNVTIVPGENILPPFELQ